MDQDDAHIVDRVLAGDRDHSRTPRRITRSPADRSILWASERPPQADEGVRT